MKTWKFVDCSGNFLYGVTEDGHDFIQTEVIGWNNEVDESDFQEVALVRAIILDIYGDLDVEVMVNYVEPDAKDNIRVRRLVKELEDLIVKEVLHYING